MEKCIKHLRPHSGITLTLTPVAAHCLALLALGSVGCGQAIEPITYAPPSKEVLLADSRYMNVLYESSANDRNGPSMRIDLADEAQHQFVLNRLLASGKTPDSSPHLFDLLERDRARAVARRTGAGGGTGEAVFALDSGVDWCGHHLPLDEQLENSTTTEYTARALAACKDGADYVYADLTVFKTNYAGTEFTVLGSVADEQYGDGKFFESAALNPQLPTNQAKALYIDSFVFGSKETPTGSISQYSYNAVTTAALPVKPSIVIEHPTELIGGSPIRSCLERGGVTGNLDCDYRSVKKDPMTGQGA
jgi:hypothetical protein